MLISALYPLLLIARWEERMTVFVAGNDSKEVSDVRSAIKSNRTMFELEVVRKHDSAPLTSFHS